MQHGGYSSDGGDITRERRKRHPTSLNRPYPTDSPINGGRTPVIIKKHVEVDGSGFVAIDAEIRRALGIRSGDELDEIAIVNPEGSFIISLVRPGTDA